MTDATKEKEQKILNSFISILSERPELIVSINKIKIINAIYKKNYSSAKNFNELKLKFKDYENELAKSHAALCEIRKQHKKKMALQPSILTECFMAQSIANILGLDKFEDYDAKGKIPAELVNTIFKVQNNKAGSSFRYIYFNAKSDVVLFQCGDSSTIDAVFIKEKIAIRIEFKDELAKINEVDIQSYDENGKLIITDNFKSKYPYYVPFVEIFNKETDVFSEMGHNFSLVKYIDEEKAKYIIDSVVGAKFIDLYILLKGNSLVPIAAEKLFSSVGFAGSEIRTAGKNPKKLWSEKFAKEEINRLGGRIENDRVFLPLNEKMYTTGRGTEIVTRYKINSLIFVRIEHTKTENKIISFPFDKIEQLKPTISLHLTPL